MLENLISVREASQRYGYSESHVCNLLIKGLIKDEKIASVWLVDCHSIEQHRTSMEHLGKKKYVTWAKSSELSIAVS